MAMYSTQQPTFGRRVMRMMMRQVLGIVSLTYLGVLACSPTSLVDVAPANTVIDPSTVKTASAATQLYNEAVTLFYTVYGSGGTYNQSFTGQPYDVIVASGVFTDELQSRMTTYYSAGLDERTNAETQAGNAFYGSVQQARNALLQASQALALYAPNLPKSMEGRAQAYEGYTILWLAELYCSGVPLTRQPLVGSTVVEAGSTTTELFQAAAALFDSAMVNGVDSASVVNLAKVGKGRALLGQGLFDSAAAVVQGVPTDYVEYARYNASLVYNVFGYDPGQGVQVVDREGTNGLVWSTDPRTAVTTNPAMTGAMLVSAKYSLMPGVGAVSASALQIAAATPAPTVPIRIADGVEARLIEAEAALRRNDGSWLTILNTLRSNCVGAATCATAPGMATGSLPPLTDPGSDSLRVDTLFHERAKWLYLTAHREGDFRRLVHFYNRRADDLWPTGNYANPGFPPLVPATSTNGTLYGVDVVFNPISETTYNHLYQGCFSLDP